ncbi:MAG: glycerol-3-phosphate dehydrogenase C-terminal domain-containing protein, partial [Limisphaerales bacterium]
CVTRDLHIHGFQADSQEPLSIYGSDAGPIRQLMRTEPDLAKPLHPHLAISGAQVVWAVREEMARTVEDVLARRTRALFLNARAAVAMAPGVAQWMASELEMDELWQRRQIQDFNEVAQGFLPANAFDI